VEGVHSGSTKKIVTFKGTAA